jgi:hypothetical protein
MRIKIKLPKKLKDEALALAQERNKKEKRFGGKTYNDTMTAQNSHNLGIIGEAIAAYYLEVPIDSRIFHNKGDDGVDLVHPTLGNIAVKTTTYWDDPYLRAEVKRDFEIIDTYILCYVNPNLDETWIIGYISRDELHKNAKVRKLGKFLPLNYILGEDKLQCLSNIKNEKEVPI